MAWADEARCLHCNGKLPLFRKLRNGQFCSTQHEKEYWAEQERLAVEVLHRTHDVLMAYKPLDDVELIIGPAVEWNPSPPQPEPRYEAPRYEPPKYEAPKYEPQRYQPPEPIREEPRIEPAPAAMAGFCRTLGPGECSPVSGGSPTMFAEEPAHCEVLQIDLGALAMAIREAESTLAEANAVAIPLHMAENAVAVNATPIAPSIREALLIESTFEPAPIEFEPPPEEPPPPMGQWQPMPLHMAEYAVALNAPAVITPSMRAALLIDSTLEPAPIEFEPPPEEPPPPMGQWQPMSLHMAEYAIIVDAPAPITLSMRAALLLDSSLEPAGIEFEAPPEEPIPPTGEWQPMPMWAAIAPATTVTQPTPEPIALAPPMVKMVIRALDLSALAMHPASLQPTPTTQPSPSLPVAETVASLAWLRLWSVRVPVVPALGVLKKDVSLRMAGGSRYATRTKPPSAPSQTPSVPLEFGSGVQSPEHPALSHQDLHQALNMEFRPDDAGLVLLRGMRSEIAPQRPAKAAPRPAPTDVEPFTTEPWLPGSGQEPIRWNVPALELESEPVSPLPPALASPEKSAPPSVFQTIGGFWKNAPRDLRLLIFAIPMLLALAFHPSLPKVHVSTVQATEPMQTKVGDAVNGSWNNFKMAVSQRAAVALDEDFRQGLDEWQSPGGVATEWSFDANGFVRPGSLALYSPTLNLTDYQAQFLAIIDKKALSWVVRAADFDNYYVIKLVVLKPGPLTTLGMTRYAVIKGKAQDRTDTMVPLTARPDMIYRVRVDVHDDVFAVAIQGQMVDAWSEPRLRRGGIGFFSARGEASRVRWLQVTHQYDTLGRLCSYLAPYDLAASNSLNETTTNTNTNTNNSNQNGSWKP